MLGDPHSTYASYCLISALSAASSATAAAMSTTLRPWLHQYITALPKPEVPLPPAASLQITDYSTEPPPSPSDLPRVTAVVSDGHLRIRAPVDEEALRAVRESTPLPQWRGALIALDNWTLSYTLDEFVLQLHTFHVLQAVGSSDIGSARHCMDDQQVRHTHTVLKQADTQHRHQLVHAQHAKLFPKQPLPPPSYSVTQPIPAELAAIRPPSADLSFLYSVPELCQRELDRLSPKDGAGGAEMQQAVAGAGEASGVELSQWSSSSDEKDEKDQEYFSQYTGIRPPTLPLSRTSASPLFPPLTTTTPLFPSSSSALSSTVSATSSPAVVQPSTAPLPAVQPSASAASSLLLSQSIPHNAFYSQLSLTPSPPQPHQLQAPPSPSLSVSSASSQLSEDLLHIPSASQHNLMETSLERDAMQPVEDTSSTDAPLPPPPSQPVHTSQIQLAQPRDEESSLQPSQPLQPSQSSESEEMAVAAEPFVDDGFFMTQAPSVSDYASQLAASQAVHDELMESDDVVFDLDDTDGGFAVEEVGAPSAVGGAAAQRRPLDDISPSSMPPLSPGPPSPSPKHEEMEERKEGASKAGKEISALEAIPEAEVEQRDEAAVDEINQFSAEMITRRQRERNAELLRQRHVGKEQEPLPPQEESKQEEQRDEQTDESGVPAATFAKRGRGSVATASNSERADKRRRSVRFDDERNTEHVARDDVSDGLSVASESGHHQSLADLLRAVAVEEVVNQPMAVFDGWSGDDFAWHCSYWTAVQL